MMGSELDERDDFDTRFRTQLDYLLATTQAGMDRTVTGRARTELENIVNRELARTHDVASGRVAWLDGWLVAFVVTVAAMAVVSNVC